MRIDDERRTTLDPRPAHRGQPRTVGRPRVIRRALVDVSDEAQIAAIATNRPDLQAAGARREKRNRLTVGRTVREEDARRLAGQLSLPSPIRAANVEMAFGIDPRVRMPSENTSDR